MAILESPSPREVVRLVAEQPNAYFAQGEGRDYVNSDADINKLAAPLLQNALTAAELKADTAAAPYDFPLSREVIATRWPSYTPQQVEERYERQSGPFKQYALELAASKLCLSLKPKPQSVEGNPNETKRKALKQSAEESLQTAESFVQSLLLGEQKSTENRTDSSDLPASACSGSVSVIPVW